jgi:type II secretory pathway predicted ATPase ExeA
MVKWPIVYSPTPTHSPSDATLLPEAAKGDSQPSQLQLIGGRRPKLFYERFGISENPFGVTPNGRYLYQSKTHSEARSSLIIGIECGLGFQALIAPPGMGKTTILFSVLERFNKVALTAFLFQIHGTSCDFLRYLISELGGEAHHSDQVRMQDTINQLLIRERRAGRQTIIVIDEAQVLDTSVLETIRLLSNFETSTEKLLHIILAGQPQLAHKLADPEMAQLQQRISILTTLVPFGVEDTGRYIAHRLMIAGYKGPLFTSAAVTRIWQRSGGVPREINTLCFNALLLAGATEQKQIDAGILDEVVNDLDLARIRPNTEVPSGLPTVFCEVDLVQSGTRAEEISLTSCENDADKTVDATPVRESGDIVRRTVLREPQLLPINPDAYVTLAVSKADGHHDPKETPLVATLARKEDGLFDQRMVEWFMQRGGVWCGTVTELFAEVKTKLGVEDDLRQQSPAALYAHLESHREIFHSLGLDVTLRQGYPRMVSLRLRQDEAAAKEHSLRATGADSIFRSPNRLPPAAVDDKTGFIDFSEWIQIADKSSIDSVTGPEVPERFVNGDTAETATAMLSQSAASTSDEPIGISNLATVPLWRAFKRALRGTGS